MPVYTFDLAAMLPATFSNLILPEASIPVTLEGAKICEVDIPESGRAECDLPQDVFDRLTRGVVIMQPLGETHIHDGRPMFQLIELEIVEIL